MHAPHGLADAAAVVVNHDVARMHMAREVDFGHGHVAAQGIQPGAAAAHQRIGIGGDGGIGGGWHGLRASARCGQAAVAGLAGQAGCAVGIERIDHQVVHIHQQVAAGAPGQLGEEIGFAEIGLRPAQVGRQVFDGNRAAQALLHPLHVGGHHGQRLVRPGDGQQVGGMHHAGLGGLCGGGGRLARPRPTGKTGVVAHAHGVNALHQPGQLRQVPVVQPHGRAQRQAHPVQADRVQRPPPLQHLQRGPAVGKEVFAVDFQKRQRGPLGQHLRVVRMPPAQAHAEARGGRRGRDRGGSGGRGCGGQHG